MNEKRLKVFVSCGQSTAEERALGKEITKLVEELTPYSAYFAENQHELEGITENILKALHFSAGFIAIMHPRGRVSNPLDETVKPWVRGSVWVEQEVGIAAFISQALGEKLAVRLYVHADIFREGLRDKLHLNPVVFHTNDEITSDLRTFLPTWQIHPPEPNPTVSRLREIQQRGGMISIQPTVPLLRDNPDFRIDRTSDEVLQVTRVASAHIVEIPVIRISSVLPPGALTIPTILLDGRLQYITLSNKWVFFPERPATSDERELGFARNIAYDDVYLKTIQGKLRGCMLRWMLVENVHSQVSKGIRIFYDEDGCYLTAAGVIKAERFILGYSLA